MEDTEATGITGNVLLLYVVVFGLVFEQENCFFITRWASLTNSDIYVGDSKYGDAVGLIRSEVSTSGDTAQIAFYTLVNDGSELEQLYTNNTIDWSTTSSWDRAGYMSVSSALRLVNSVNWVANGYLQYADHAYSLKAAEFAIDGFNNFLVNGNGRYGGNWNSW